MGIGQILVAVFLCIFILCWKHHRTSPFANWPILGMLPSVLLNVSNIHDYATAALKYYGGTLKFEGPWLTSMNFVITSDPINVQHITCMKFDNYEKGTDFKEIFDVLGDGIFNSDSQTWKYNRAILHSLFKQARFQLFFHETIQKKVASCLLPFLEHASSAGVQVDLQDAFQRFTFDNICTMVLGFDPGCLSIEFPKVACEKAFNELEDAVFYRHVMPRYLWKLQNWLQLGKEKRYTQSQKILDEFLYDKIASKSKMRCQCSNTKMDESRFNLLNALMEEEGVKGQIDDKFLRDTAINLLAAGRDTISASLSWFFWLVASSPSVEAKILEEIKDNLPAREGNWRDLSVEGLSKLVYLHGAICEALRLFPPIPFEHKRSLKSDILPSGHCIDSNTMVLYSLYSMGRMEEIWGEDCLEFRPERWVSERGGIIHIPSYKFIAFNAGPRSCLGKDMSFTEMKVVATAILWNYHIHVVEGHPISPSVSVVLHMKHGLKVKVIKRCI